MSEPKRIQRRRTKGWRMPEGAIYVGRPTKWGNPFTVQDAIESGFGVDADIPATRKLCAEAFDSWLTLGPSSPWWYQAGIERHARLRAEIGELRGKDLACWCPLDEPCHADVLLRLANKPRVAAGLLEGDTHK